MKPLTNKDFNNSVTFWKDLAKMRQGEINRLKREIKKLQGALKWYARAESVGKRARAALAQYEKDGSHE